MADFLSPKNANPLLSLFGYVREGFDSVARMFDGTSDSNVPTGAKKIDGTTKEVFQYNGTAWDSLGFVNDTVNAGAIAAQAQADATQAQADATQAGLDIADLSTKLGVEGPIDEYVAEVATGDGLGGDASNYMTWESFCTKYAQTVPTNNYPRVTAPITINLPTGDVLLTATGSSYFSGYKLLFKMGDTSAKLSFGSLLSFSSCYFSRNATDTGVIDFLGGLQNGSSTFSICALGTSGGTMDINNTYMFVNGNGKVNTLNVVGDSYMEVTGELWITGTGNVSRVSGLFYKTLNGASVAPTVNLGSTYAVF